MKSLLQYMYYRIFKLINYRLGIKHILQYFMGFMAGALAYYFTREGSIFNLILVLVGFSILNQFLHILLRPLTIQRMFLRKKDGGEEGEEGGEE